MQRKEERKYNEIWRSNEACHHRPCRLHMPLILGAHLANVCHGHLKTVQS